MRYATKCVKEYGVLDTVKTIVEETITETVTGDITDDCMHALVGT